MHRGFTVLKGQAHRSNSIYAETKNTKDREFAAFRGLYLSFRADSYFRHRTYVSSERITVKRPYRIG